MNLPDEEWALNTRRLGRRVLIYHRTDSTNSVAARLAEEGAEEGVAVLADEQTAGRGQHGRSWHSAPRTSVLLSLLVRPPFAIQRPAILTAWAAVAVCKLIHEVAGIAPRIKWPNDVLLAGRKVCGILIEQGQRGQTPATIVGIGLNVRSRSVDLAALGLPHAASLGDFLSNPLDTHDVAIRLIQRLDADYDALHQGQRAALETAWREHLGLTGEVVLAECGDTFHRGLLRDLTLDRVTLETPTGTLPLRPEVVTHLEADPGNRNA